jgi:putative oxidoreductase
MVLLNRITAALLGLVFVVFGSNFFLKFLPIPQPPEGSPAALFLGGMFVSGMLAFIKVLEITGGVLIAIPKTRNLGLLVLGPIILNIFAFHFFFFGPASLVDPLLIGIAVLSVWQVLAAGKAFWHFLKSSN